jgi:hypothetical protein
MIPIRPLAAMVLLALAGCGSRTGGARTPAGLASLDVTLPAQPNSTLPEGERATVAHASSSPDPDEIDVASLPLLEVLPAPRFELHDETKGDSWEHWWMLSHAEKEASKPIEWDRGPRAHWAKGKGTASIGVVITRDLDRPDHHQAQGWLRFLQANAEAPAMTVNCGWGSNLDRAVEAYRLEPREGEAHRYTHQYAWFNYATCKGRLLRSYETEVRSIANDLAFAYRSRCAACGDGTREVLNIVLPSVHGTDLTSDGGRYTYWTYILNHVSIPITRGAASSFVARIPSESIAVWNRALRSPLPVEPARLRVELSWGTREPKPLLVVNRERM